MILNSLLSRDLLIDAYKFYCRNNAQAHDALIIIISRNEMPTAVLGCIEQALKQDDVDKQNLYLRAACFGMKKYPGVAIEEFSYACRRLRVMNICRALDIDPQLSIDHIVDLLIAARKFKLALWIVNWMHDEGEQKIRAKWSDHIIDQRTLTDFQAAEKIQQILGQNPVIPYADIASKAIEHNRIPLAITLIESERQSSRQIPLLMKLKKYDLVLAQALATCDSNLIYMAIFKLQETMPNEIQFLELVKKHPLAFKYYCNFLAVADIQKLIMICHKESQEDELLYCLADNRLESALLVCKKLRRDVTYNQIDYSLRLNKFQQSLDRLAAPPMAKDANWVGLSASDTIINLISLGKVVMAKDCQKKFEVSEKKFKVLEQIALKTLPKLSIPSANP